MKMFKSIAYALNGIRICFLAEANFKIHVILAACAIVLAWLFSVSTAEWAAIIFCIAFVLVAEMLNTAIEILCDVLHKEFNAGIKKVKDVAAGAVLLAAVGSGITGVIIFLPKLIYYLQIY